MWQNLLVKLKAILTANTLIQEVYDYEVSDFNGQPAVVIVPSDSEGEYSNTIDNERIYAFSVFVFVARAKEYYTDEKCDVVMRSLVDSILDDFDKNWQLTGLVVPTGYSMLYMESAPSMWGYANREMVYRMAEIKLRVHIYVDTTVIT